MSASTAYVPSPTPDLARVERALISVSDKTGVLEFARVDDHCVARHRRHEDCFVVKCRQH